MVFGTAELGPLYSGLLNSGPLYPGPSNSGHGIRDCRTRATVMEISELGIAKLGAIELRASQKSLVVLGEQNTRLLTLVSEALDLISDSWSQEDCQSTTGEPRLQPLLIHGYNHC